MRVAVFEPKPRLCGVTAWTFHVAQGFRDLGHECDVVTFSRSGKPPKSDGTQRNGWYWWHEPVDVTDTWYKAGKVLDGYDLIVLNELKNGTEDREAQRLGIEPFYIGALRRTKTPWMSILHAAQYDPKRAPYLANCLDAGNFTGVVVEHQAGSYESGAYAFDGRITKMTRWPWLPYRLRGAPLDVQRTRQAVVAGRSTPVKGHAALARVGDRMPDGWVARLAGSEAGGAGACFSYTIYEKMTTFDGWAGHRWDPKKPKDGCEGNNNCADKLYAHPWYLRKGDKMVHYTGAYSDQMGMFAENGIALNLTAASFALGVEYSVLEAMDAGCVIIAPGAAMDNAYGADYRVHRLEKFTEPSRATGKGGLSDMGADVEEELIAALHAAAAEVDRGYDFQHNRQVIAGIHAPQHLANHILEVTS